MTNILFICRHNRFRSRIATAYFNKISTKENKAKGAGVIKGLYPLSKNQVQVAKEFGINMGGKPQGLSIELLKWADYHVIVADDVPASILNNSEKFGKKLLVWKIPDAHSKNLPAIRKSIKLIIRKVDEFYRKLR